MNLNEKLILKILPLGASNTKTFKELKSEHKLKMNIRTFRGFIEELRRKGYAIGAIRSNNGGYYLIESESEREKAIAQYRAQAHRELDIIYRLERADLMKSKLAKY